jgi:hypothetical protein
MLESDVAALPQENLSLSQIAWRRFKRDKAAMFALGIVGIFVFLAIFANVFGWITHQDPYLFNEDAINLDAGGVPIGARSGQSTAHWLGVEPGTGRDLYCINYILAHINPGVYNIFIKALIGAVIAEDVSDHVITDCSGVHNEEGLYKITHRTNIKSFKYSPLTSIIIFIRMIKFYNKYSESSERVKIGTEAWKIKMFTDRFAEIEELKKCTDFCSLYIKPIFVIKDSNFYFHNTDIILNAKEFSWFNNPKEIFDISTALLAGWITHAGDFERINHVLSSIEYRF